ncbi:hypothetical protein CEXT_690391 [Caerostris extrusa]|uniref:Uncharacterized protein n=1 Tax=Caerostris extrusa TaxID=172846 RepID=A0AAV4XLS2_CAEEX|nr:hypothetical protein CEXT_690391 [Caerostris extrusa]
MLQESFLQYPGSSNSNRPIQAPINRPIQAPINRPIQAPINRPIKASIKSDSGNTTENITIDYLPSTPIKERIRHYKILKKIIYIFIPLPLIIYQLKASIIII